MSDLCKCGHAEDHHFTPRLGGRCFRHECECVAFEPPDADRDDLAAILAKHKYDHPELVNGLWHVVCVCGGSIHVPAGENDHAVFRAHVAQMVLESDWLRGVRAKELRDAADAIQAAIENPTDTSVDAYHFDGLDEAATICRDRADRVDAEDTDNTTDRTYKIPD